MIVLVWLWVQCFHVTLSCIFFCLIFFLFTVWDEMIWYDAHRRFLFSFVHSFLPQQAFYLLVISGTDGKCRDSHTHLFLFLYTVQLSLMTNKNLKPVVFSVSVIFHCSCFFFVCDKQVCVHASIIHYSINKLISALLCSETKVYMKTGFLFTCVFPVISKDVYNFYFDW